MSKITPREQIDKEESLRYPSQNTLYNSIVRAGFKEGAEYGYNLAIENVVEWLLKNTCERYNKSAYADVKCENCVSQEEFINNLKNAMKL